MTLAEFYATHRSPQAIVVPRRTIRLASSRPAGRADAKAAGARPEAGAADKKH
ncbi:MAG TPA: hypothetical protein VFQ27_04005 [Xanthobacteraceae bacterium]|nr:hypothetical protein [Xanthobacteraceae bacterium]